MNGFFRIRREMFHSCDMLVVHICWEQTGMHYFTRKSQIKVLSQIGRENYIKLPKRETNSRGIEITSAALQKLAEQKDSLYLPIHWKKQDIFFNVYERWIKFWEEG